MMGQSGSLQHITKGRNRLRGSHLWSNMHEGHGLGLATQGVLQQLGELGVAEGDVVLLGCQGRHDIARERSGSC